MSQLVDQCDMVESIPRKVALLHLFFVFRSKVMYAYFFIFLTFKPDTMILRELGKNHAKTVKIVHAIIYE